MIKYTRTYYNPFSLFIGKRPSRYRLDETEIIKIDIPGFDVSNEYYALNTDGYLIAKIGCTWDGASGGIDTQSFMRASLFHDILCYMINDNLLPVQTQPYADKLLRDLCIEDGMSKIRAWNIYLWVRGYQTVSRKLQKPLIID